MKKWACQFQMLVLPKDKCNLQEHCKIHRIVIEIAWTIKMALLLKISLKYIKKTFLGLKMMILVSMMHPGISRPLRHNIKLYQNLDRVFRFSKSKSMTWQLKRTRSGILKTRAVKICKTIISNKTIYTINFIGKWWTKSQKTVIMISQQAKGSPSSTSTRTS